jgi:hypothetical protein
MDSNLDQLADIHIVTGARVNEALRQAFTLWLAKLYFGLLYWEAGLRTHNDPVRQEWFREILNEPGFKYMRKCLIERLAFKLPSSLFHFHVPDPPDPALRFDFGNGLPHGLVYVRFRNHLLVSALGDANLVSEWFTDEHVKDVQKAINEMSGNDPLAYIHAVAHIWAVREWLPVQPRLEFEEWGVREYSREGHQDKPPINAEAVNARAEEIFLEFAAKWTRGAGPDSNKLRS